jgi:phosphate:Na+ symporter
VLIAGEVGALPDARDKTAPVEAYDRKKEIAADAASTEHTLVQLDHCAKALRELQQVHRKATFSSAAGGSVSADEAIARVDTVWRLEALAHHAWCSAAHLVMERLLKQQFEISCVLR